MNRNTFISKFYYLGFSELYPTLYKGLFNTSHYQQTSGNIYMYKPARKRGTRGSKRIWRNILHKQPVNERKRLERTVNHQNLTSVTIQDTLHGGLINARSVNNKADELGDLCTNHKYDFLAITETWLKPNSPAHKLSIDAICPSDEYTFLHQHRTGSKTGGGVGFLAKRALNPAVVPAKSVKSNVSSFEYLMIQTVYGLFIILYRPPKGCSMSFYAELDNLLALITPKHKHVTVLGDINIHLDCKQQLATYQDVLSAHDLHNHTTGPTHIKGHTLDTVASATERVIHVSTADIALSDHFLISFYNPVDKKLPSHLSYSKSYVYRDYKSVDNGEFIQQLKSKHKLDALALDVSCPDKAMNAVNLSISSTLDELAPEQSRKTKLKQQRHRTPWSEEVSQAKRARRKLERQFLKSGLTVHTQMLVSQISKTRALAKLERQCHYSSKLRNCRSSRDVFVYAFYNSCTKPQTSLPSYGNEQQIARDFGEFFIKKTALITATFTPMEAQPTATTPSNSSIPGTIIPTSCDHDSVSEHKVHKDLCLFDRVAEQMMNSDVSTRSGGSASLCIADRNQFWKPTSCERQC